MKLKKLSKLLKDDNVEVIVIHKKQENTEGKIMGIPFERPADNTLLGEKFKNWEHSQKDIKC